MIGTGNASSARQTLILLQDKRHDALTAAATET